ncbi:MAG: hypothetical protein ABI678_02055 [Kofleriaceae bacterium]
MAEARTSVYDVLRLTGLLLATALATSRLGLLAHELAGHGGTATVLGGRIRHVELFWFAGGWIEYDFASPPSIAARLAISMGGIAIELVVGAALWFAIRGDSLGRKVLRAVGAVLVVHASWYLATGAWHGFGDGHLLRELLGERRYPLALAAGALACFAGFFGARRIVGPLAATQRRHPLIQLVIAAALAGGAMVGLAQGELWLRRDATYSEIMKPEPARRVDQKLAQWAEYERTHGGTITPEQQTAERVRLERVYHEFPFKWLLAACAIAAILAGAWLALRAGVSHAALPRSTLVRATATAAIGLAAVIAIDLVTR